jgi:hypothetical protein
MTRKSASRQRILKVREMQMQLAINQASQAQHHEQEIKTNSERLRQLCMATYETAKCNISSDLSSQLELAQRLMRAESSLKTALENARQKLAEAERQRLAARIDREAAEKLRAKADHEEQQGAERKQSMMPQRQRSKNVTPHSHI